MQCDVLAYVQYVLSGGLTTYNNVWGAVIITLVMLFVSWLSATVFLRHFRALPAIHHLPSALLLASLTDVQIRSGYAQELFGTTWIWSLAIFVVALIVDQCLRGSSRRGRVAPATAFAVSSLWQNFLVLLLIMLYMVFMGNTNEADLSQLHLLRDYMP